MRIGFIGWGNMGGRRHATCNAPVTSCEWLAPWEVKHPSDT